jgi:hypothetical protein
MRPIASGDADLRMMWGMLCLIASGVCLCVWAALPVKGER